MTPLHERPCAGPGLTSYRAKGPFGWIMIGARSTVEAWSEARRSTDAPTDLQIWTVVGYVPVE